MTHAQFAADADALTAHLGFNKVAVMGHSYGGFIALEFALRYPDRVSHHILLDTAPAFTYHEEIKANALRKGATEEMMTILQTDFASDEEMRSGKTADLPPQLNRYRDAPAYFGVIKEPLATYHVDLIQAADIAVRLEAIIEARKVRDWVGNPDVENQIRNDIEDYLYDVKDEPAIPLSGADMDEIMDMVIDIARHRNR
jgi:pimeloyl-ACP methyl ester carboxylesterase